MRLRTGGLAAFRKYIPADLVKTLVSEGVEPSPGGSIRNLTVMFADIAGFTGLSERVCAENHIRVYQVTESDKLPQW